MNKGSGRSPLGTDRDGFAQLTEVGSDSESTYFLPPGLEDHPLYDSPGDFHDSAGSSFGAPLTLVDTGAHLILEPFGIRLTRRDPVGVTEEPSLLLDDLSPPEESPIGEDAASPIDEVTDSAGEPHVEVEVIHATEAAKEDAAPLGDLVPRGRIEVRILRDLPDLVGELVCAASPAAVDLVAYLATHGHRVSTARLRDSIGTQQVQASRAGKTVWSAAGAARRALGLDLLPTASGNQLYELSTEVTCDWMRFRALVEIAKRSGIGRERARVALIQALALVDGVPGVVSRRFIWLDTEGLLTEIAHAVAGAAAMLATLELDGGSLELARMAIDRGLVHSPGDPALAQLHRLLGQRRREHGERTAAVAGV